MAAHPTVIPPVKIYLTHPFYGKDLSGFSWQLEETQGFWAGAAGASDTALVLTRQAQDEHETHPMLLTRIWKEIMQSGPGIRVISETDFLPHPLVRVYLKNAFQNRGMKACFASYATRADSTHKELEIFDDIPAPAFLAFLFDPETYKKLPETWLENTPELDNPASGAFLQGLAKGLWEPNHVLWSEPHDEKVRPYFPLPLVHYPHLGTHYFYSRHFADDVHAPLADTGILLGQHLAHIDAALACAKITWPLGQSPWGAL